jgi:hypothetical protein
MSANAARCTLFTVALLIGLRAWAGAPPVCLDPGDQWSWAHPMPHGHSGQVVRWIPERGEFVAMGDAVLTTTDGVTWTPGHVFAPWMVMDFHWDGSAFVAVAVDVSCTTARSCGRPTWSPGRMCTRVFRDARCRVEWDSVRGGGNLRDDPDQR